MKIDRLIGIITLLQQQEKTTAPALAKRFEVSRRTINRDIEDICMAGIPLVTTQGHGGGISIADGYKIDKFFLKKEELQMVFTALKGLDSVSKTSYLPMIMEKLSSKETQVAFDDSIIIDLASHYQKPLTQKIDTIKKAITNLKCISFCYYSEKGESSRKVEPYKLIFKWSCWYVFGFCLERNDFRLFKLNRLWNLETLNDSYEERYIPESKLNFESYFSQSNIHLIASFSGSQKHRLIDEYGIDCFTTAQDGRLNFERDFASYENMLQWVFSFGDKVRVIEPERLSCDILCQSKNIINAKNNHDV